MKIVIAYCGGLLALLAVGLAGCEVLDPSEEVPAYLKIERPRVILRSGDTTTVPIPDVWTFYDNDYIGTFEPPLTIPVPDTARGQDAFFFTPGVWVNGQTDTRERYLVMQSDSFFTELQDRDTVTARPVFRYKTDSVVRERLPENFEDGRVSLSPVPDQNNDVELTISQNDPYEGQHCGKVQFTQDDTLFFMYTPTTDLPREGVGDVWAEVTYRGDIKFGLGLYYLRSSPGSQPLPQLTDIQIPQPPSRADQWQTVHFRLNPLIQEAPQGSPHRLYFLAESDGKRRELFLDHIKILHFR
jgi:hypothetical protein